MATTDVVQYQYDVLDYSDEALIREVAECLAETFTGVKIGNAVISEPMTKACKVGKEAHLQFVMGYLQEVIEQGFCFVARDPEDGRVVGALACDIFNPDAEPPVFEGELAGMNHIIHFLEDLDAKFKAAVLHHTGEAMQNNHHIHLFMSGIRTRTNKKQVWLEMFEVAFQKAKAEGFKGLFGEATNIRCQNLFYMMDYYVVLGANGEEVSKNYSEDEVFRSIPEEEAVACKLMYKSCDPSYMLR